MSCFLPKLTPPCQGGHRHHGGGKVYGGAAFACRSRGALRHPRRWVPRRLGRAGGRSAGDRSPTALLFSGGSGAGPFEGQVRTRGSCPRRAGTELPKGALQEGPAGVVVHATVGQLHTRHEFL